MPKRKNKSQGKAKVKWARAEISKQTKGMNLTKSEKNKIWRNVWKDAKRRFG